MNTTQPVPGAPAGSARASHPEFEGLHRRLRFHVLGLVVLWAAVIPALNLWWAHRLTATESRHHMLDQALALARQIELFAGADVQLSRALNLIAAWPGRFHEIDLADLQGRVIASTYSGERPAMRLDDQDHSAVTVQLEVKASKYHLRLWMFPHRLSEHFRNQLAANVAVTLTAGLVLTLLIGLATTRATRSYDRLLTEIERLEEQDARAKQLELLGKLAAGLAHEIRNPLNALGLGLQRIRNELVPLVGSPAEQWSSVVSRLHAEVHRLNRVVEEFLSLARTPTLALDAFDLGAFLRELPHLYAEELKQAGIHLELQALSGGHILQADREKLGQAVLNLLRNAAEAASGSGARVQLTGRCSADAHCVEVADNGPGPNLKDPERLFELFYTSKRQGTGLGLPIARRLVEAHGGTLVCSRKGGWTVFTIRLPRRNGSACGSD